MNIKLIIGLGNPGKDYANTYHSAGIMFIDAMKKHMRTGTTFPHLAASDTYMNTSGAFVKKTLARLQVQPKELLVAHDDSDLELGSYKLAFGQGAAGHNGVTSIITALETQDFWRLRIGIRPKELMHAEPRAKAGDFVLRPITKEYRELLDAALAEAALAVAQAIDATASV
jgi:peptidyl-tRNA hydrolase, PTH1 family